MNKVQHVKWCVKQTKLTSEIFCPTDSCLAQLVEHETDDPEVVDSNPTGQFLTKFILFCVTLNLSDNLTETRIVKNWTEDKRELQKNQLEVLTASFLCEFHIRAYRTGILLPTSLTRRDVRPSKQKNFIECQLYC